MNSGFPIKHDDCPVRCQSLPEGKSNVVPWQNRYLVRKNSLSMNGYPLVMSTYLLKIATEIAGLPIRNGDVLLLC